MSKDWNDRAREGSMPSDPEDEAVRVQAKPKRLASMLDAFKDAKDLLDRGAPPNALRSGFYEIDHGMKFFGPEEVTMLAADSGVGKSTLATQFALHAAMCGHGVVYVNLEMPSAMYGLRTVANFMRVNTKAAAAGEIEEAERSSLTFGFERLRGPARRVLMGNMSEHRTIPAIKALVRQAKDELAAEKTPLSLVIIDHVLKVLVNVKNDKDAEGHARSDLLKELVTEHKAHVLGLVHITREGSRGGKMPTKNDLASSAWFDRDADNIMIFHQRRLTDGTFAPEPAQFACQKARWSDPFAVELKYQGGFFYPWQLEPTKKNVRAVSA